MKNILIWTIINGRYHPLVSENSLTIGDFFPIMLALFPEMECHSSEEFYSKMNAFVIPTLNEALPSYLGMNPKQLKGPEVPLDIILANIVKLVAA